MNPGQIRQGLLSILAALSTALGAMTGEARAQGTLFDPAHTLLRAEEARALDSPAGMLESLTPALRTPHLLPNLDEEARFLNALASGTMAAGEAELKLLRFIEEHPHSAYLPYAVTRLAEQYYARGDYSAAAAWYRRADINLLEEDRAVTADYYYAYALLKTGRDEEALRKFLPLTYAPLFRDDAAFYAGYLLMKAGKADEALPLLQGLYAHKDYAPYARAFAASGLLSLSRYSDVLALARETLGSSRNLPSLVRLSLLRSAGLAETGLGDREAAVGYLTEYASRAENPGRLELLMLGKNLQELTRSSAAIQYLEQVPDGKEDFMSQLAFYYLGLAHLSSKNTPSARSAFERAETIASYPPLTEASAYNAALAAYSAAPGKVTEGSGKLAAFVQKYPSGEYFLQAVGYLEDALLGEPDNAKALRALAALSPLPKELVPVRERLRLGRANTALTSGNADEAARQYQEIISRNADPQSVAEAYLWKGEAAYRNRDYRGAITSTLNYLRHRPEELPLNPNAYFTLGYAAFNLRDYSAAKEYLLSYLSAAPDASRDARTEVFNRLGDIAIQGRDYDEAMRAFKEAEDLGGKEAPYALFAHGMALGLTKDYRGKAELMSRLPEKYPSSDKVPEALFEQGQALTLLGDGKAARAAFDRLLERYPSHAIAPKAGIQLALSYFNDRRLPEAALAYKAVIRDYPRSPEARTALSDLKSIAVTLNEVDEYDALARETGLGGDFSPDELDRMTYLAAERLITEGTPQEAEKALGEYVRKFPRGKYLHEAYYSKALLEYNAGSYRDAALTIERLTKETPPPSGDLGQKSYKLLGAAYDKLGEPGRAAEAYLVLARLTPSTEERSSAVRLAAERAEKNNSIAFLEALAAGVLSGNPAVDNRTKAEVYGYAAARYAKGNQKSDALRYARAILALPGYSDHTMSRVIIALDLYDRGEYAQVRDRMSALAEQGSTDAYWLARGFILLADAYAKLGDKTTARTYLESVRESYPVSGDGILDMAGSRLQNL